MSERETRLRAALAAGRKRVVNKGSGSWDTWADELFSLIDDIVDAEVRDARADGRITYVS